ncbi:hypothetical protein I7I48_12052 [Histoplasma ohiense]|nr:hypothetical protein I7I48_12052 [Histoplasma ohiense (nom. inval.)]
MQIIASAQTFLVLQDLTDGVSGQSCPLTYPSTRLPDASNPFSLSQQLYGPNPSMPSHSWKANIQTRDGQSITSIGSRPYR